MPQPTTVISEKAVGRIVEQALDSVPGCIHHASGLDKVTGRELPRTEVDLDPDNKAMSIEVQIAARWPSPVTQLATTVREVVHDWVVAATNIPVINVDVCVAAVVPAALDQPKQKRITASQLESTPRTPQFDAVQARPLKPEPVQVKRAVEKPCAPQPISSVPLEPIRVNRTETNTSIPKPAAITPFKDVVTNSHEVVSPTKNSSAHAVKRVQAPRTSRPTEPISVAHKDVQLPVTPQPLRPQFAPTANRRSVESVSLKPYQVRHTDPIDVNRTEVHEQLTPTPITPTITPDFEPYPVAHLVGDIEPRLDPIYVESTPMVSVTAYPLRPKPVSVERREVVHPEAPATPVSKEKVYEALEEDEKAAVGKARAGWPGALRGTSGASAREAEAAKKRFSRRPLDSAGAKERTLVSDGRTSVEPQKMTKRKGRPTERVIPVLKEDRSR